MVKVTDLIREKFSILIFIVSLAGVFGSLYFSEVVNLPPCDLCWYQRILFYPIFILSASALSFKERLSAKFVLAFTIPGMLIAGYQYLLQKFGLFRDAINCSSDNPCSQIDIEYLGFITIPLLAFAGFLALSIIAYIKLRE